MKNQIDWGAERKRFEAWFAVEWMPAPFLASSTLQHVNDLKARYWVGWEAALTYGLQDVKPDADSDTIEVRIPVAVSDENEVYAERDDSQKLNSDVETVLSCFLTSQVHIVTARVPKYRIPEIAADKVEPADTEDAT